MRRRNPPCGARTRTIVLRHGDDIVLHTEDDHHELTLQERDGSPVKIVTQGRVIVLRVPWPSEVPDS